MSNFVKFLLHDLHACSILFVVDYDNRIKHRLTESMIIIMNTILTAQLENFVHYCILYWSSWAKLYINPWMLYYWTSVQILLTFHCCVIQYHQYTNWCFKCLLESIDVPDVHPCRTLAVIDHLEEKVFELTHLHTCAHRVLYCSERYDWYVQK